jgi:phytoene synthase
MPASLRPAFATLWNLDLALADVIATTSEPALGAIRLAWWRERLEEVDQGAIPAEPRLSAIARQLVSRGITGKELARLEHAWLPLLEPFPWAEPQVDAMRLRGELLFRIGAQLLGGEQKDAEPTGALWSLVDAANHVSDPQSRDILLERARKLSPTLPRRVSKDLRPLTVLAALAAYDLGDKGSGVGRVAAAVAHRARGTFPRS